MPVTVLVPASMRTLTDGAASITAEGHNLRAVIADIAKQHPALAARLQNGDRLGKGLSLSINGDILSTGLITKVEDGSEIAILPQISGGADDMFTVKELVDMYRAGDLQLPVLQRKYVWNARQVCSLLDSLYRGYPSGSMLRWQAPKGTSTKQAAVKAGPGGSSPHMLLDGQQRLTTLSAVLYGDPVNVNGRRKPIEIFFNMDHVDDDDENAESPTESTDDLDDDISTGSERYPFAPVTSAIRGSPSWVSVTKVLRAKRADSVLSERDMNSRQDPERERRLARLKRLRQIENYHYRVETIGRERTYSNVVDVFVRVNSHGTKLSAADLALAQVSTIWEGAVPRVENLETHYSKHGYKFNASIILRALMIFATDLRQCRFGRIGSLSEKRIRNGLDLAESRLDDSLDFMRNDLGVDRSDLLASNFVPIVISTYLWKIEGKPRRAERNELGKWALLALSWGRYSGSGIPMLEEDIREIRLDHGLDGLMTRLRQSRGSVRVTSDDLVNRDMQNPMFKTILLAFRENDIEDWLGGGKVSWANIGISQKLNIHHIFPRAMLRRTERKSIEINDIANLAFINAESNQKLSDRPPSDYLVNVDPQELRKQCVPQDQRLWQDDAYDDFLEERRKLLARRLNQFLKVTRDA